MPPAAISKAAVSVIADDYGLAPGLGVAIRDLIAQGRLQGTGCMTGSPHWPEEAKKLKELDGMAHVGVHLTLTDQQPLGPCPRLAPTAKFGAIARLTILSQLRALDRAEIAAELERQIDAFEAHFGRPPDFLDGHQHVHHLPIIRDVVVDLWHRRMGAKGWIRSCWEPPARILARDVDPIKTMIIAGLGAGLDSALKAKSIPHNRSFRGVYDLTGRVPFAKLFRAFTDRPSGPTLVMVHPGLVDAHLEAVDPVTGQREVEYRYLASDECALDLARRGITLAKLPTE
jgi:hypothetical protein